MSKDFNFFRHQILESIVVTLDYESFNAPEHFISSCLRLMGQFTIDKVVMTISKYTRNSNALLHSYLVIVTVYSQRLNSVLICHFHTSVVIV